MRVKVAYEGDGVQFDAADPAPFIAAAGNRYVGTDGGMVLVRAGDGSVQSARPGWWAVRPGDGRVIFVIPDLVSPA